MASPAASKPSWAHAHLAPAQTVVEGAHEELSRPEKLEVIATLSAVLVMLLQGLWGWMVLRYR
jgi:hypothetical protein